MDEIINLAKEIGQFIAFIIVSLFFCKQYLNQYFKKTNVGKMLPKQNKLDLEILNKLEYVKEILNADRIHVYEFHNGEHYSDYRSAYKFSCTYEVFKAGNQPVQQKCINLPTNCMPQFIHRITEDGKFICRDLEELKEDAFQILNEVVKKAFEMAIDSKNINDLINDDNLAEIEFNLKDGRSFSYSSAFKFFIRSVPDENKRLDYIDRINEKLINL